MFFWFRLGRPGRSWQNMTFFLCCVYCSAIGTRKKYTFGVFLVWHQNQILNLILTHWINFIILYLIIKESFKIKRMSGRYFQRDFRYKGNISTISTFLFPLTCFKKPIQNSWELKWKSRLILWYYHIIAKESLIPNLKMFEKAHVLASSSCILRYGCIS